MVKLTATEESKTRRILVYGPPKSGKSELVGYLAEYMNLDWFDLESGSNTLRKMPIEYQDKVNLIQIPDSRVMPMAIETCLKVIRGGPVVICHEHGKVACPLCKTKNLPVEAVEFNAHNGDIGHCVVFDSITQLSNSAIANITRNKPDDYKMERDDWGNLGKVMDQFLSQVQAARYNIVCISHEIPVEMNDGKEKLVPIGGTRNFSRNTAKYFDDVVYCTIQNKAHKFASSTTYMANVLTGSRSGKRLEDMKEAKLWELFK